MPAYPRIIWLSSNYISLQVYRELSLSPLNFRLVSNEIQYVLGHCDARLLFVEEEFLDLIMSIRGQLPNIEDIVVIGEGLEEAYNRYIRYEDLYRKENIH